MAIDRPPLPCINNRPHESTHYLAFRTGAVASDTAWRRVSPFKGVGRPRTLFLTDVQVRRLLDHADGAFRGLCETVIVTGARPGELANARVRDFSRTDGTLSLTGKTGHRTSYLSQQGFEMFTQLSRGKLPGALLLPNDAGMPWRKEHWRDLMMRARKTAHLPADTVMYSLRHYAVSKMLVAGVAPQVTAENTGTSIRMIERHYGKFTALDRRTMLDRVEVAL